MTAKRLKELLDKLESITNGGENELTQEVDKRGDCGYTSPMSKTMKVEMKLGLDPKLKARLRAEARLATALLDRTVSLNEYAVAVLSGVIRGQTPPALHRPTAKRTSKEKTTP